MQRIAPTLFFALIALSTISSAAERTVKHVVLVSVDGLSASYLTDQRAEMPNLRALAQQGAIAEGMRTSFPSVTWPSHTSIVTGMYPAGHGVIGNAVWNRATGERVTYIGDPVLTKDEAIKAPTLYDIAHQAGLSTASVIWPCSNGAKTLDWVIPDSNKQDVHDRFTTPGFAGELAAADIDISKLGEWGWGKQHSTQRDVVYTQVTKHLLAKHKVNLILVHLITPDGVEHNYGPNTPEAYQAVAESDDRIQEIWEALQQPPFKGDSAMFVVSDHGFAPYTKRVRPNVVLHELGLIETDDKDKVTDRTAWCVSQGGSAFIYVLDDDRVAELSDTLATKFEKTDGILSVMRPDEFTKLGVGDPANNPEAPHLVLTTGPGYSFADDVTGDIIVDAGNKGTHGHDPRPDYMHATFVAVGKGIKPGVKLGVIDNIDVAPTIANLLGLEMDVDGQVLKEVLE